MNRQVDIDFLRFQTIIFYPKTEEKARQYQEKLFALGFEWGGAGPGTRYLKECARVGMTLINGDLFFGPVPEEPGLVLGQDFTEEDFLNIPEPQKQPPLRAVKPRPLKR